MKNPFSISFGRVPNEYIRRSQEKEKILEMFTELPVTDQLYVLLGVRGSGKTVTMTDLCDDFEKLNNWIVVKISPVENILDALYQILYHDARVHTLHTDTSVALSLPMVNISMNEKAPAENTTKAIDNILSALDKKGLNVLVAIDKVTNTAQMRAFISAFQIFVTNRRPIFFLATALFEEMEALRDVRNLTFLYRAPRLILSPLDIRAMAGTYQRVFGYTKTQRLRLAKATNGYSLAFPDSGNSWKPRCLRPSTSHNHIVLIPLQQLLVQAGPEVDALVLILGLQHLGALPQHILHAAVPVGDPQLAGEVIGKKLPVNGL